MNQLVDNYLRIKNVKDVAPIGSVWQHNDTMNTYEVLGYRSQGYVTLYRGIEWWWCFDIRQFHLSILGFKNIILPNCIRIE